MRIAVPAALDRIWREKAVGAPQNNAFSTSSVAEQIYDAIEALRRPMTRSACSSLASSGPPATLLGRAC